MQARRWLGAGISIGIFYSQMVATEDTSSAVPGQMESPGTFGKLRQTLSSSLLTAQDKGSSMINIFLRYLEFTRLYVETTIIYGLYAAVITIYLSIPALEMEVTQESSNF